MNNKAEEQKKHFIDWAAENLGEKTGVWYAPCLEQLGFLLEKFGIGEKYQKNFFDYRIFEDFKVIYKKIIGQEDNDIPAILKGYQKRYPESYAEQKVKWTNNYAHWRYAKGERRSPDSLGGIPDLGVVLRAYLKFLYYAENSELTYPKRDKKIASQDGEIDDSVNYWIYAPGDDARMWKEFYKEGIMGLGWDSLGELKQYQTREEIEKEIAKQRNDSKKPTNDSKTVWDFYKNINLGDVVYVKAGLKKIIGCGIVTGEYYFDSKASEYKHRRKVNWTNHGLWYLHKKIPVKTLTNYNKATDIIVYINKLINGETVEENTLLVNEFKIWLSQQIKQNGDLFNDKTITQKISSLKDIEKYFNVVIFGETDTEVLKDIKEAVLADGNYNRYKGVSGSSLDYYIRYVESRPTIQENEAYSLIDFLNEVFIDKDQSVKLQSVLQNKKNLILKGAPGVGKTFIAKRLAYLMMEEKDYTRVQFIQFHQSYSYEDFIEGYRPKADGEGFELRQGPFVKFARKAARDPERDYFFIIDEINRGNISKIFGELLMLIESDKRGQSVNLLYSDDKFSVPQNLYIIGMMNTADRSLALLDYALRRRFSFFEIKPAFENSTFTRYLAKLGNPEKMLKVISVIEELNEVIENELGSGFKIGHSYFVGNAFKVGAENRVTEVVEFEIIPQLYEYWFDDEEKATKWAGKLREVINEKK